MWGWKAAERLVEPSISFEEAKRILLEQGFQLHASHPAYAVFKSTGTENPWTALAPSGRDVPIELAVASSHSGLCLHLRYETFVLFDTGDLESLADEIARLLSASEHPASIRA